LGRSGTDVSSIGASEKRSSWFEKSSVTVFLGFARVIQAGRAIISLDPVTRVNVENFA
jgi:hypothetical protein